LLDRYDCVSRNTPERAQNDIGGVNKHRRDVSVQRTRFDRVVATKQLSCHESQLARTILAYGILLHHRLVVLLLDDTGVTFCPFLWVYVCSQHVPRGERAGLDGKPYVLVGFFVASMCLVANARLLEDGVHECLGVGRHLHIFQKTVF